MSLSLLCLRAFRLYYLVFEQPIPEPAYEPLRRVHWANQYHSCSNPRLLCTPQVLVHQVTNLQAYELEKEQRFPQDGENSLGSGVKRGTDHDDPSVISEGATKPIRRRANRYTSVPSFGACEVSCRVRAEREKPYACSTQAIHP